MEILDQRNAERAMPCVPVLNASAGKAVVMAVHLVSFAEGALLNATTMKTLVSSRIVPVVGLAQATISVSL